MSNCPCPQQPLHCRQGEETCDIRSMTYLGFGAVHMVTGHVAMGPVGHACAIQEETHNPTRDGEVHSTCMPCQTQTAHWAQPAEHLKGAA